MLPDAQIDRTIRSVIAEEIGRITGRPVSPAEWQSWTSASTLDEDDLGLDSLALLEVVARLNRLFHLHETGAEDYLLVRKTLGDWTELVGWSLGQTLTRPDAGQLTFQTSGSTGDPKQVTHRWADFCSEIDGHAGEFRDVSRIVALVPPHHIYGFLFTVLLPTRLGCELVDGTAWAPGSAAKRSQPGDLIIATPFLWDIAVKSGVRFAENVRGVTSGAPAEDRLWGQLGALGLSRLAEIYGSTETAGVGLRDAASATFRLLPHLVRGEGDRILRASDHTELPLQDNMEWSGQGTAFRLSGRKDNAVQVGGVNVRPSRIADRLSEHPLVSAAAIRLDQGTGRLKAFIVPSDPAEPSEDATLAELKRFCTTELTAPERPVRFTFGPALPTNQFGKATDWN